MRRALVILLLLASVGAGAQVAHLLIPAGSPEDKALQAINAEGDAEKRIPMLQSFLQQFAGNPQAVIYGQWQLGQQYLDSGDIPKAMDYGQKALAGQPNNLDILVFLAGAANKAKAYDVVVDCAVRGATAFNGIASEPKPEGVSPELFADHIKTLQEPSRGAYEFLEVAGLNAMVAETSAKKRMGYVERYIGAFPGSRFQEQVMALGVSTLGELKDSARLQSFSEKALVANPKSVTTLVVLSEAFGDSADPGAGARAESYARKALDLTKDPAAAPSDAGQLRLYTGLAHSALGYALLKEDKNLPAIAELKTATGDLKGQGDSYSAALYRLGFAYAKTGKLAEAKVTLTELAGIQGPYQGPARDLLAKVEAGAAKASTKRGR
jgi:tetratricopeptide (TPR) repeat protein